MCAHLLLKHTLFTPKGNRPDSPTRMPGEGLKMEDAWRGDEDGQRRKWGEGVSSVRAAVTLGCHFSPPEPVFLFEKIKKSDVCLSTVSSIIQSPRIVFTTYIQPHLPHEALCSQVLCVGGTARGQPPCVCPRLQTQTTPTGFS